MPFVIGVTVGVPLGAYLLTYINPAHLCIGIGVLLIVYRTYNLARPTLMPSRSIRRSVGILSGLLGGLTGLGGVIITI